MFKHILAKTKQEVIRFYFRKMPLHQQKVLVVSVFSEIFKKCPI